VQSHDSPELTCYRGQLVSKKEFEIIKSSLNQCISINTFFSTSTSSTVAVEFFADGGQQSDAVCVLFEMLVDTRIRTKPFAPIHQCSANSDEGEILFTMGTIFKIESCDEFDGFWHIQLTLSAEPDQALNALLNYYEIKIGETSSLLVLGEFLHKINELNKAERYYQLLTKELPHDHVDVGMAFNNIGTIYTDRGEYKQAKTYLRRAFKIFRQKLPIDDLNVAEIYLNLATLYDCIDKATTALKYEKKALEIQLRILPDNHLTLATTYNNIADTYNSLNRKKTALKYYHKTLKIELEHLPSNHPDLAVTYNNMAAVYTDMRDYRSVREYVNKAFGIRKETLPFWHQDLADSYRLLANLSAEIDETADALEKYQESLRILSSAPAQALNQRRISEVHSDIGELLLERGLYQTALRSFKMSLHHLKQCEFVSRSDKSIAYIDLGRVYFDLEKYDIAKKYCRKSLRVQRHCRNVKKSVNWFNSRFLMAKILYAQRFDWKALTIFKKLLFQQRRLFPDSFNELINVYKTLGDVYLVQKRYKKSQQYMKTSIEISLKYMPARKIGVAIKYEQLATIYMKRLLPKQAIKCCKKAINIYLNTKPPPSIYLAQTYYSLGNAFLSISKYSTAKFYLLKASELYQENVSPNDLQIAKINTLIGRLELSQKRYPWATEYYQLALSIYEQQENLANDDLIYLHNLLSVSLTAEQKFDEAIRHCQKVLHILEERMSKSCDDPIRTEMLIGKTYENMIQIYLYDKKFDEALTNAQSYLKISRKHPMHYFNLSNSLRLIGSVYRNKQQYKKALRFLQEARHLVRKCSDKNRTDLLSYIYAELAICYENTNDHRQQLAYKYYNLARKYPLSATNENLQNDIDSNIKRLQILKDTSH
jgi:tetratricopeptide (TPR) repeat protein